jgi:hypothetical protein
MFMKKNKIFFFTIGLLTLTSCGQQVSLVYDRLTYHTGIFADNMYEDTYLSNVLKPLIDNTITYDIAQEDVVVGVASLNSDDLVLEDSTTLNDDNFAKNYQLSLTLPSLSYGFESKLFDGILYCTDAIRLSKSRLQLTSSGMGHPFPSKLQTYDYTGVFMKAGADTNAGAAKITDLNTILTYYVMDEDQTLTAHRFVYPVSNLRQSDFPQFYGFYFEDAAMNATTLQGAFAFSFEYEIINEDALNSPTDLTGIFFYELLLPKATWR